LDVGCGPGRHSIELARRGYRVVGIDPSPAMIAAAEECAREAGVNPSFQLARGEDFTSPQKFDAAICLFTTLGQIGPGGENQRLVQQVAGALQPGGAFMVEIPQRAWVVANLKPSDRFGSGEDYTQVNRAYDPETQTVTEHFKVVSPQGSRQFVLRYRLYSHVELGTLLEEAGLDLVASYGDYGGHALDDESATMIALARKKTETHT
jgi:SAM-dependent methyltransferase